ncbi:MAG: ribosome-associated translation inhibitor RaiA [Candidatus Eisenbacteria bacterium]|nr:ribosome-associated translation inhibitor RaiA [Candidatus Eisenbacteria bacterium]
MQVSITARHFDLTEGLRKHAEEKLERLSKYGLPLQEAHVVLAVEKHRHKAEVTVHGNGFRLTGASESDDMYASVDQAAEKLETQVQRRKGKVLSRKQKGHRGPAPRVQVVSSERSEEDQSLRVLRSDEETAPSLTVEEAIRRLREAEEDYVLFTNPVSERLTVVLRRKDGDYGVIEV